VVYVARGVRKAALHLEEAVAAERRSREDAERGRQALEVVTESRARLLRGFTHDVKNPLGAADGHLALLEDGVLGALAHKQRESVGRARRAIRQALHLIGQLLDIARAEAGQLEITIAPARMDALLRDVADDFRAMAAAKNIALDVDVAAELPRLLTDVTRVDQILGNLVSNAVKYTPPGGHVTVRAGIEESPAGRHLLRVSVVDSGSGIAPDRLPLLFREFTRLDPGAAHGSGIGLAISQRIAKALGGAITVESTPGVGSTFTLRIPVEIERSAHAGPRVTDAARPADETPTDTAPRGAVPRRDASRPDRRARSGPR
jgi:signal transduction histidine kinase